MRSTEALPRVGAIVAELHYDLATSDEAEVRSLLDDFQVTTVAQGKHRALLYAVR
jgi:hypothetical protein